MTDFKKLNVLVIDQGLFPYIASRLGEDFGTSKYFTPWENNAPTPDHAFIGLNLPNMTRVDSIFDTLKKDKPELVVFTDVGMGDLQEHLRELGFRVFGSGKGEILEDDRTGFKKVLEELKLPVSPYQVIDKGVDQLREELKKVKDKYVKLSLFRGVRETFHHIDFAHSKSELNAIAHLLGDLDIMVEFIIDDPIPSVVEIGSEWFVTDDGYLPKGMFGIEEKNLGYVGKICNYEDLPKQLKYINDKFLPVYQKYKVRGTVSTEVRITKDGKPYFTDPCLRYPSPPGAVMCEAYHNLSEIMWNVADGKVIEPKQRAKYWCEVMIQLREVPVEPVAIDFPDKFAKRLKFRNLCRIKGQYFYLPSAGETIIGSAIGYGNELREAQDMALDAASKIQSGDVYYDKTVLDTINRKIKDAKSIGLKDF